MATSKNTRAGRSITGAGAPASSDRHEEKVHAGSAPKPAEGMGER